MEKAQEILIHISELYTENPLTEDDVRKIAEKNPTRYQAWVDAFKDYDLSDILLAIDNYWEFKNSKTKPNVAQIKAILNTHKAEKEKPIEVVQEKQLLPTPTSLMHQDVEAGNCHYNLPTYNKAFEIVTQDWLAEILPADVYATAHYPQNVQLAYNNGLFNRFNEALQLVASKKFEKTNIQFQSKNDMKSQKSTSSIVMSNFNPVETLSAHWRAQ